MQPNNWEAGDFTTIAARDIEAFREVIKSLQEIECDATTRLRDEEVTVAWHIIDARKRFADERRLAHGRVQLTPKRVLVESPWLNFGNLGSVIFRLYPRGDGSALSGGATIFLWMARAPGVSFSFNVQMCRASSREDDRSRGSGAAFATAPRLWQADMVHYRMDVCWSEVAAVLNDLGAADPLELTLNVLQWHKICLPEEVESQVETLEPTLLQSQ